MDRRLFPFSVEHFRREVEPLIACHHRRPGMPPGTAHDLFFPGRSMWASVKGSFAVLVCLQEISLI